MGSDLVVIEEPFVHEQAGTICDREIKRILEQPGQTGSSEIAVRDMGKCGRFERRLPVRQYPQATPALNASSAK